MGATNSKIQLRRDTAANWSTYNPTLSAGEPGFEIDTGKLKIGDGQTTWANLSYAGGDSTSTELLDKLYKSKMYEVGGIEDTAVWMRVAELDFDNELSVANGRIRIGCISDIGFPGDNGELIEKSIRLGAAEFCFSALKLDNLTDKSEYVLDITPISNSIAPVISSPMQGVYLDSVDLVSLFNNSNVEFNGGDGGGSGYTTGMIGISHARLAVTQDNPKKVYLDLMYKNATAGDKKKIYIELINSNGVKFLDQIDLINSMFDNVDYSEGHLYVVTNESYPSGSEFVITTLYRHFPDIFSGEEELLFTWEANGNGFDYIGSLVRTANNKIEFRKDFTCPPSTEMTGYILTYKEDEYGGQYLALNEDINFGPINYFTEVNLQVWETDTIYVKYNVYHQESKTLFDTPVGEASLTSTFKDFLDAIEEGFRNGSY